MPQVPQNPTAKNANGVGGALLVDSQGGLITGARGKNRTLNVTAATVIKAAPGVVGKLFVNTAGSTAGTLSDTTTTGGVAAANLVATIPNTVGIYDIAAPFNSGIVLTPGTGQAISIVWS